MIQKFLALAALLIAPAMATVNVDPSEHVSGTVHVILNAVDPTATLQSLGITIPPQTRQKGVMVCVLSDDPATDNFDITVVYAVGNVVRTKHSTMQRQFNPASDWTNEVFWLGFEDFAILSVSVRESHESFIDYAPHR